MANVDQMNETVKKSVLAAWDATILFCNRVLQHCHVYGIRLMDIPNPNIHDLHNLLKLAVLPVLTKLAEDHCVEPEDGIKIDNIRQYSWHLEKIVAAIDADDERAFSEAVAALSKEAHIHGKV